ncbi:hypothetical protein [Sulfurimonas sp.]|jgi:uncharacterized membrane protein YhiD involved in acid resistance|uniref:hypothetical protein n=1 Tax=Sulfurimonas sp. TaxID=2022749 RepID=UPI002A36D0CF|nr:hypothetical protein [Sulfurimonas sp.]MDY0122658.1 hypothetical protein [Sulfurimonas sp.]
METEFIIKAIIGLIIVLAVLIFLLFLEPSRDAKSEPKRQVATEVQKESKDESKEEASSSVNTDLFHLVNIIKNRRSNEDTLSEALELIIKHHGKVHKKLGLRPHPDFDTYIDILFTICRHPNANKDMIITFDRELERLNPEYKKEINEAIAKGLNSRGF